MILHLPVSPIYDKNFIAITLQTSNFFAPYASVTIQSILEHAADDFCYDIIVMTWDMKAETAEKLTAMANGRRNISIRVVDVSNEIESYVAIAKKRSDYERFSATGVIRLLLPELLTEFDKILNLDCDMVLCADAAELDAYDLSEYYMGGVQDIICYVSNSLPHEKQFTDTLIYEQLRLKSVSEYINAGVLLLNLKKIRNAYCATEIVEYARKNRRKFFLCYEQDAFNGLFQGHTLKLPAEWNWFVDANNLIRSSAELFPKQDESLNAYFKAEKKIKIIHFVGGLKPWNTSTVPKSQKWWLVAQQSPLFDEIFSRIDDRYVLESNTHKAGKAFPFRKAFRYLLFIAESGYQLLNVINIKYRYYRDIPADVVLVNSSDVKRYAAKLEKTGLFQRVIISQYSKEDNIDCVMSIPIRTRTLHPERCKKIIKIEEHYTDYFISDPGCAYQKMIYYRMVNMGFVASVHIYEDGRNAYSEDYDFKFSLGIENGLYPPKKRIENNLIDVFLYKPELYSGKGRIPQIVIPEIKSCADGLSNIIDSVFGKLTIPKEKFLFLGRTYEYENQASMDIMVLESISKMVGKDNIAMVYSSLSEDVSNLYALHGYHVISDLSAPWALAMLSKEIDDKVLLSAEASLLVLPYLLCGKKIRTISLINIMKLSRMWYYDVPEYQACLRKFQNVMNDSDSDSQMRSFSPGSTLELYKTMQYIVGGFDGQYD